MAKRERPSLRTETAAFAGQQTLALQQRRLSVKSSAQPATLSWSGPV